MIFTLNSLVECASEIPDVRESVFRSPGLYISDPRQNKSIDSEGNLIAKMEEEVIGDVKGRRGLFLSATQSTRHCALRAAKSIPRGRNGSARREALGVCRLKSVDARLIRGITFPFIQRRVFPLPLTRARGGFFFVSFPVLFSFFLFFVVGF